MPINAPSLENLSPEQVKVFVERIAAMQRDCTEGITDHRKRALIMAFTALLGYIPDAKLRDGQRHRLLKYFFGVSSSKELTNAQAYALLRWMIQRDSDSFEPREEARPEAVRILNMLDEIEGQLRLEL